MTQGRRLVLLRHGRTADNAANRIQGQVDAPQPPILVLDEAEIQSYGVATLDASGSAWIEMPDWFET